MKTIIRLISFVLVLVMLVSCFIACNNPDAGKDPDTSDPKTTPSDTATPVGSKLPEMDLDGEIYDVLGRDYLDQFDNFEISYDELPEDVVGQAVYKRNEKLYNKYNFIVSKILVEAPDVTAKISYEAGDDLYDLVIYRPNLVQAHAQEGYLLDLNSVEHINLNHECWTPYVNEQLTIGGKLYYTTNDFLLEDKNRAFYLFYNRDLARELNLGHLEDFVDNNTWTLEKATELAKQTAMDIDNNGPTHTDRYGFATETVSQFITILMSAGFRITEKDNNGYPKLVGATDKMLKIVDETIKFTNNKSLSWCRESDGQILDEHHPEIMFLDNRVLLLSAFTTFIDYQYKPRQSSLEFGVLPNPKFNSEQDQYCSYPDIGCGSVFAIPYTVYDDATAGFCLEALSEASTDTSYYTFIETKCKYQDAYDEDCARMMDICFNNPVYDVGAFCDFGKLYTSTYRSLAKSTVNIYKRLYDTYKKPAQKEIDKLVADYGKR